MGVFTFGFDDGTKRLVAELEGSAVRVVVGDFHGTNGGASALFTADEILQAIDGLKAAVAQAHAVQDGHRRLFRSCAGYPRMRDALPQ
jgi:hypothetical protein